MRERMRVVFPSPESPTTITCRKAGSSGDAGTEASIKDHRLTIRKCMMRRRAVITFKTSTARHRT
jgi:hypothetical protein